MRKALVRILAIIIGLIPGFFIVFNSVFSDSNGSKGEWVTIVILIVASYGIPGLIFGYLSPKYSWRWGIWINIPAIVILTLYSFKEPNIILLSLFDLILTLLSACGASFLGAKLRLLHENNNRLKNTN